MRSSRMAEQAAGGGHAHAICAEIFPPLINDALAANPISGQRTNDLVTLVRRTDDCSRRKK